MKIVILGGTGLIGSRLLPRLTAAGHHAVAASPSTSVDTLTGRGVASALGGADAVVDVINAPSFAGVTEFFETSTRTAVALVQPIAADDVAAALATIALAPPADGIVEIAGPEQFPLDELLCRALSASSDPRPVVTDPGYSYFGAPVERETLVPGPGARLAATRYQEWVA
jgi:uncharacterized protein YbjT (DUF2867 family)